MKQTKIYIPNGARACDTHLSEILWSTIDRNTTQRSKFTTKQIEDLIELLRDSGTKVTNNPGLYFFFIVNAMRIKLEVEKYAKSQHKYYFISFSNRSTEYQHNENIHWSQ